MRVCARRSEILKGRLAALTGDSKGHVAHDKPYLTGWDESALASGLQPSSDPRQESVDRQRTEGWETRGNQ